MLSSPLVIIGAVFIVGAVLFGVGTVIVQRVQERSFYSYEPSATAYEHESQPHAEAEVVAAVLEPVTAAAQAPVRAPAPVPEHALAPPPPPPTPPAPAPRPAPSSRPAPELRPVSGSWLQGLGMSDDDLDAEAKIDMIERLGLIGEPWCIEALRAALNQESDLAVKAAIAAALPQA